MRRLHPTGHALQMWLDGGVLGGLAALTEIKETAGQGHLSTCLLRQLSFIIICLSVSGSCYCSAIDLFHMVTIVNTRVGTSDQFAKVLLFKLS